MLQLVLGLSALILVAFSVFSLRLNEPEACRLLAIRWKLFRLFPPWRPSPYRVVLRYRHRSFPWPQYWTYVSLWPGERDCEIGPLQMWSLHDAVRHAADQWRRKEEERQSKVLDKAGCCGRVVLDMPGTDSDMDPEVSKQIRADWDALVRSGVKLPVASPVVTVEASHQIQYVILRDANVKIRCSCGQWESEPSEKGHQCLPENCEGCAKLVDAWKAHVEGAKC